MPTTFRPYQPDQSLLLPPDLRDWLPEEHLAHHVSDLVDDLDLREFYVRYEGDGRRKSPYEPRMMVKVLIYGYATGVFSSRALARKLEEDVAFRVLALGNFPSHRTICEFRRRHFSDFKRLFVMVVRLAAEMGVVNFGKLSIDGTKIRANASKRKAMSYGRILEEERRLEAEVGTLLDRARAVDAAENERFGKDARGDELPQELRRQEDRLAASPAAKARLEGRTREADEARGRNAASTILIEIGPDIHAFGSKERLAAWAGLCPGNNESGGKRRNAGSRPGSRTLRAALVECAHGAARTKGCQFEAQHRSLAARRGYKRAIVAVAHKMLRIIHAVLRTGKPYYDCTADYEELLVKRNAPRWIRMLLRYRYITPSDAQRRRAA